MEKTKLIEFDILKGILIVFVVIGHAIPNDTLLHQTIFWFHMPAFFMISGFFSSNPKDMQSMLIKKSVRLILPYFSWSILLYVLYRPESLVRNVARVVYGGVNNTTIYSYPFWFVNALFIASLLFSIILCIKSKFGNYVMVAICVVCYILVHSKLFPLPYNTPWAIEVAISAIPYMLVGHYFRNYEFGSSHWLFCFLPIIFLIWQSQSSNRFCMNMKHMFYKNILFDFVVPCSFSFAMYLVSCSLAKLGCMRVVLARVGAASMTIMFTHAALLYSTSFLPALPPDLSGYYCRNRTTLVDSTK